MDYERSYSTFKKKKKKKKEKKEKETPLSGHTFRTSSVLMTQTLIAQWSVV